MHNSQADVMFFLKNSIKEKCSHTLKVTSEKMNGENVRMRGEVKYVEPGQQSPEEGEKYIYE